MKNWPTPLRRTCRAFGISAHPGIERPQQWWSQVLSFFGFAALAQAVQADASSRCALFQIA